MKNDKYFQSILQKIKKKKDEKNKLIININNFHSPTPKKQKDFYIDFRKSTNLSSSLKNESSRQLVSPRKTIKVKTSRMNNAEN